MTDLRQAQEQLSAPFPPEDLEWKPQVVSGDRAMVIAYITARGVMDRLDAVVGIGGWQDHYEVLPEGNVVCTLRLLLAGEWIEKVDVGAPSDQKDEGDRRKASFSDALKRAAVKFGVGRYLYSLPQQWVDYDPKKKQLKAQPQVPHWAIPKASAATPAPVAPSQDQRTAAPVIAAPTKAPANGQELLARLAADDAWGAGEGLWPAEALLAHVTRTCGTARKGKVAEWAPPYRDVDQVVKQFRQAAYERREAANPRRQISAKEAAELKAELVRAGKSIAGLLEALKLHGGMKLEHLNLEQWQEAMRRLAKLPDKTAAAATVSTKETT